MSDWSKRFGCVGCVVWQPASPRQNAASARRERQVGLIMVNVERGIFQIPSHSLIGLCSFFALPPKREFSPPTAMKLAPKLPAILASASLGLGQLLATDHAAA